MALQDIDRLKLNIDTMGQKPIGRLILSDIPNISEILQEQLAGKLSKIEELPAHDATAVWCRLNDRGEERASARDALLIDFRLRPGFSEEERSKLIGTVNYSRNACLTTDGSCPSEGNNFTLLLIVDEPAYMQFLFNARDIQSFCGSALEMNQADLPQAAEMTREQAFGARPIKPEECKA